MAVRYLLNDLSHFLRITKRSFFQYVSNDEVKCFFIHAAEHLDNPLATRSGLTLVPALSWIFMQRIKLISHVF